MYRVKITTSDRFARFVNSGFGKLCETLAGACIVMLGLLSCLLLQYAKPDQVIPVGVVILISIMTTLVFGIMAVPLLKAFRANASHPPKEHVIQAYLFLLEESLVFMRYQTNNNIPLQQVHDLCDAIHNIPELVLEGTWTDAEYRELYLKSYDEKWSEQLHGKLCDQLDEYLADNSQRRRWWKLSTLEDKIKSICPQQDSAEPN